MSETRRTANANYNLTAIYAGRTLRRAEKIHAAERWKKSTFLILWRLVPNVQRREGKLKHGQISGKSTADGRDMRQTDRE